MRTTIQIVGLGERMKGTSGKTGRDYDFQTVSFLYPDKFITGMKAATAAINGAELDAIGGLIIGSEYKVIYHFGAYNAIYIDAILC